MVVGVGIYVEGLFGGGLGGFECIKGDLLGEVVVFGVCIVGVLVIVCCLGV